LKYFPEPKECQKLPRQFVVNVLNLVIGEPFINFITERMMDCNAKILQEQQQIIEI
jgi:hypothetical protein